MRPRWQLGLALVGLIAPACASIEAGRYGLRSLEVEGNRVASDAAITQCMITRERADFELGIGLSEPSCGAPPFDSSPVRLRLWRWPWTEWPSFNRAVFEHDLEGVLRFYRARGHYDAKIVEVRYEPSSLAPSKAAGRCQGDDCRLGITIVVAEGEPTRVESVTIAGLERLPVEAQRAARAAIALQPGHPPDEARHDKSKRDIQRVLYAAGWAGARVSGRVQVDAGRHTARVAYDVEPGPLYHFGRALVEGHGLLPREVIENAANLASGQRFDPDVLLEIQAEVFALGAFSAVEVEQRLDPQSARADVQISVTPLPPDALRVGAGVLSGAARRTDTGEQQSIPQWDVHVFGRYQRRHLLGSLAQLTLEDRPRLIFSAAFPALDSPRLGNVVSASLNQPGWPEARTTSFARSAWDYGPDPYLDFVRSDLYARVGLTRGFLGRKLLGTLALQQDVYTVLEQPVVAPPDPDDAGDAATPSSSYRYTYLEEDLRLDARDSRTRPSRGVYLGLNATQAPRWAGSDWTAVRLAPEVRTYVPLPLDIVFAQRLAIASLFVLDAAPGLDPVSFELGPTNYRLRGGGASSNRGFLAGTLGDGIDGGTRRWEASLELRLPIGKSFVLAGFADAGDVSRGGYRFDHPNTTLGYGLRWFSLIGAIRLDVGYRIASWQRADGSNGIEPGANELPFSSAPGAVHLTIGDPF